MNTWDTSTATCEAAEDQLDSNQREYTIMGSNAASMSSAANNSGKLCYRNLIFGTGRRQNRPISERTRAAESLFSCISSDPSADISGTPSVMYANSSAFFYKGGFNGHKASTDQPEQKCFLEIMNHSNLWKELRIGANNAKDFSNGFSKRYEQGSCASSFLSSRSMKAIVYFAIGTNMLQSHEVLREVQCCNWDNSQWTILQESFTIESVTHILNELVQDGLVQTIKEPNVDGSANFPVRYHRTELGERPSAASKKSICSGKSSRHMKIAKPWKSV